VRVTHGLAQPQVLLVDTRDSLLWVDGSASMATERLQLQAHVQPKDWSPLSLRAPLHIDGTLGAPLLSLDKPQLLRRAVPAALLALVHPLAALLPLVDAGDAGTTPPAAGCQALLRRFRSGGITG
jgi:AsmA family protein